MAAVLSCTRANPSPPCAEELLTVDGFLGSMASPGLTTLQCMAPHPWAHGLHGFQIYYAYGHQNGEYMWEELGEIWRGEHDPKTLYGDMKTQRINKILHVQKDTIGRQTPKKWFSVICKLTSRKLCATSAHPYLLQPEGCMNGQLLSITGGINSAKTEISWDAGMVVILLHTTVKRQPRFSITNKQPRKQKNKTHEKENKQTKKQQNNNNKKPPHPKREWLLCGSRVTRLWAFTTRPSLWAPFLHIWFWRQ